MAVYGLAGVPGMILGGMLGDAILHRRRNGRMLLAAVAISLSVPLMYFALERPAGEWLIFSILFGLGCMMMYVYYATVYSTIQDVIEPSLRATAMAIYFAAMYVFGGALGPTVIGQTSDYFANRAAVDAARLVDVGRRRKIALPSLRTEHGAVHAAARVVVPGRHPVRRRAAP